MKNEETRDSSLFAAHKWLLPVAEALEEGKNVEMRPKGTSMWPTIRPATDTVTLRRQPKYNPGDIVLALTDSPAGVFLHRMVRSKDDCSILMGDANLCQTEQCSAANVLGRVVAIDRNGKRINPDATARRALARFYRWPKLPRRLIVSVMLRIKPPKDYGK